MIDIVKNVAAKLQSRKRKRNEREQSERRSVQRPEKTQRKRRKENSIMEMIVVIEMGRPLQIGMKGGGVS